MVTAAGLAGMLLGMALVGYIGWLDQDAPTNSPKLNRTRGNMVAAGVLMVLSGAVVAAVGRVLA